MGRGSEPSVNSKNRDSGRRKKGNSAYKPIVPAVEQAARILNCLGESPEFKMNLTDLCRQVGIHKSKGYSILNTLGRFDLVEKDPQTKLYSLGPNLLFLSRNFLDNLIYPEVVAPFLQNLAKETNATAVFGLIQKDHVFVLGKSEGNQHVGFTLRLGHRFHITLGAHGKAIVAFMPEEERERILARKNLYFHGDHASKTDMKRLREEIAKCRQLGYAQDLGEVTPGLNVLSAPVLALRDKVIGCIILLGTFPKSLVAEYGVKVAGVAKQISSKLGVKTETLYACKPNDLT